MYKLHLFWTLNGSVYCNNNAPIIPCSLSISLRAYHHPKKISTTLPKAYDTPEQREMYNCHENYIVFVIIKMIHLLSLRTLLFYYFQVQWTLEVEVFPRNPLVSRTTVLLKPVIPSHLQYQLIYYKNLNENQVSFTDKPSHLPPSSHPLLLQSNSISEKTKVTKQKWHVYRDLPGDFSFCQLPWLCILLDRQVGLQQILTGKILIELVDRQPFQSFKFFIRKSIIARDVEGKKSFLETFVHWNTKKFVLIVSWNLLFAVSM